MQTVVCTAAIDTTVIPPTCSSGWTSIETGLGFDISQLDPGSIVSAFTAGATFMFVPLAVIWGCSLVLISLKGR